jgi:hypothetical protein
MYYTSDIKFKKKRKGKKDKFHYTFLNDCYRRKWEDTEVKFREFIINDLSLPEMANVQIERAYRLGSRYPETCPIVTKFAIFKDRENIVQKSEMVSFF